VFVYAGTKDPNCIRYLIAVVGRAGDNARLPVLQALVDDPNYGSDVLEAIRMIERRSTARSADADKR
jgi:hypothetical protein